MEMEDKIFKNIIDNDESVKLALDVLH